MGAARKLTKVGNSYALIIPRQTMALIGLDADTPVVYETDGTNLIVKPQPRGRGARRRRVDAAIDRVFTRYRKTMIRLSAP